MNHAAILVVDDNPDHLELTVMALCECCDSLDIATATDGVEALDYLFGRGSHAGRDTAQQPRLIILDMKLVRLHGLDVLKAVRAGPADGLRARRHALIFHGKRRYRSLLRQRRQQLCSQSHRLR